MLKGALNAVTRRPRHRICEGRHSRKHRSAGVINTPMHKPETHDFLKGLHPVGRIGEVKEIVECQFCS